MGLPQSLVLLVESVDAVNHLLDQLHLGVAQAMLVGDVVSDASLTTGLSPGTTWLQLELFTPGSQHLRPQLGPAGKIDVD